MHPIRFIKAKIFNGLSNMVSDVGPLSFFSQWFNPNNMVGELEQLEQYKGIVYACISAIAEDVAKIEITVNKTRADGTLIPVKKHPVIDLFKSPNPTQSDYEFFEMTQTHIELTGEAFWYVPKGAITGKPKELWIMRPDLVQIVYNQEDGEVSGYIYHKWNGRVQVPLDLDEVVHFKMPNPINPYRGMGTVQAGIVYIQTEDYASQYTRNALANGGTPGGIVTFKGTIPDPEFQKIKRQWQREYGGVQNGGKTAFIRGTDATYTKIGSNFVDMDLKNIKSITRDDIMFMFRVSKPILGITEDVNYASAKTAEYVFAKRVIDPKMSRLVNILQTFYNRKFTDGYTLSYTSPIPQDNDEKIAYLTAAVKNPWMTPNEARAAEGMSPVPGGDNLLVPFNLVPLTDETAQRQNNSGTGDQGNNDQGGKNGGNNEGDGKPSSSDSEQNDSGSGGSGSSSSDSGSGSGQGNEGGGSDGGEGGGTKAIRTKSPMPIADGCTRCECCEGYGEHNTGYECYRCDASGSVNKEEAKQPVPCGGREDSDELWIDEQGNYRHEEERKAVKRIKRKHIVFKSKVQPPKAEAVTKSAPKTLREIGKESFRLQIIKIADSYVPQIKDRVDHVIAASKQKVLHQLKNVRKRDLSDDVDYQTQDTAQELVDELWPVVHELMMAAGRQAANTVMGEVPFGLSASSQKRIRERIERVAKDYSQELQDGLTKAIHDGLAAGKTLAQITTDVEGVYTQWQGWRAERLARTEAVHEANYAALDSYLQSSVIIKKEWYANADACEYCLAMNGTVVSVETPFVSKGGTVDGVDGGTFLANYEDVDAGDLHPNCKCTILPVVSNE